MFRLKMINKPKLFKLKFNFIFPQIVLANMQEKEITPTKETQIVEPDRNYDGLKKVTVNKIPDEYIIPSGEIDITQNGTYNVTDKATANVNIPEKQLGTKTITKNGIYKATDDNLDGYSEVDVETSGVDINDYFVTTIDDTNGQSFFANVKFLKKNPKFIVTATNCNNMFEGYQGIMPSKNELNLNGVKTMSYGFARCSINQIIDYDFSTLENLEYIFYNMYNLKKVPLVDFSSAKNIQSLLAGSYYITDLEGFKDLGKAYETTESVNSSYYRLQLSNFNSLTHDSLMNVINNLYDIKTKGCKAQRLDLGSTNIAKLTSEEIAIATEKGWTVS